MPKFTHLPSELNNKYCPGLEGILLSSPQNESALHMYVFLSRVANGMFPTCNSENAMLCYVTGLLLLFYITINIINKY